MAAVTAFNTFHNFLTEGDSKGTIDVMDVVDLDRLFPEEDFPYTSDFAIPFMSVNSINDGFYEEQERVDAEHGGYTTGRTYTMQSKLISKRFTRYSTSSGRQ